MKNKKEILKLAREYETTVKIARDHGYHALAVTLEIKIPALKWAQTHYTNSEIKDGIKELDDEIANAKMLNDYKHQDKCRWKRQVLEWILEIK